MNAFGKTSGPTTSTRSAGVARGFRWGIARTACAVFLLSVAAAAEPRKVDKDGTVLELGDRVFVGAKPGTPPDRFEGIGLIVENCKDVTIRGGRFRGYKCAILVRNCKNVVLEKIDVSGNFRQRLRSTPEREDAGDWLWPHKNDKQEWRKNYGAGICIERSSGCVVRDCTGRNQQNGILLDRCTDCRIYDNDMSFNSGWGLAMWRSSKNVVSKNSFDWCVRGYSHGVYDRGQDSAGILVFEQCNDNLFAYNSATHGGDGFFLYAGHETTENTGSGGCNGNRLINNDFSHAVANAIEATFSRDNWFEGNRCDDSNYGIWAGYSYQTTILGNTFERNTHAGVAIEHGELNLILANSFSNNKRGIRLWWDDDKKLLAGAFGKKHGCLSRGYWIVENDFLGDETAIELDRTSFVTLSGNSFEVGRRLAVRGACFPLRRLHGRHPQLMQPAGIKVPGKRKAFLPPDHPRGRRHIMIGEWGPIDPATTAVFPKRVVAWKHCAFHVLGSKEFRVEGLPVGLEAKRAGRTIRVSGGDGGLHEFTATVVAGEQRFAISGVLLNATWKVSFWEDTKDPRKHDVFRAAPARTETVRRLDYRWAHEGDRFATRAVTRMKLPAGRYEIRTMSDDGVRVRVDGKVVQEDWTHHGPREHKTVVRLAAGVHKIVVEHFELTGYAVLAFDLRPADALAADATGYDRAMALEEERRFAEAAEIYGSLSTERAAYRLGVALFRGGRYAEAKRALAAFLKRWPRSRWAAPARGWLGRIEPGYKSKEHGFVGEYDGKYAADPRLPAVKARIADLYDRAVEQIVRRVGKVKQDWLVRIADAGEDRSGRWAEVHTEVVAGRARTVLVLKTEHLMVETHDLYKTLVHELYHCLQRQKLGVERHKATPKWMREGAALYVAGQGEERMRMLAAHIGGNPRYDSPLARLVNGLGGRHGLKDYAEDVCAFLAVERRHGRPKADALLRGLLALPDDGDTASVIRAVLGEDFATFDQATGVFARNVLTPLVETGRADLLEMGRRLDKKDYAGALALKPAGVYAGTADLYRASALLGLKRYDEALAAARSPRLRRTAKAGHARLVELGILKAMGSKDYPAAAKRALLDLEPFTIYGQVKELLAN